MAGSHSHIAYHTDTKKGVAFANKIFFVQLNYSFFAHPPMILAREVVKENCDTYLLIF